MCHLFVEVPCQLSPEWFALRITGAPDQQDRNRFWSGQLEPRTGYQTHVGCPLICQTIFGCQMVVPDTIRLHTRGVLTCNYNRRSSNSRGYDVFSFRKTNVVLCTWAHQFKKLFQKNLKFSRNDQNSVFSMVFAFIK